MDLWKGYWRQKRKGIGIFFLFCLIFFVSFLLYHLPAEAVLYPAFLCALFGALFLIFDFGQIYNKHVQMQILGQLSVEMEDGLPPSSTIAEADYEQLIRLLCQEQRMRETQLNARYEDMIEYYTLWVHQIKTPIASMHLHLQNEDTAFSRKLYSDLFRIEQYVEMVLMFLRLDAEDTDYVIETYDLDVIVRQAVKKFAGEFIDRQLSLRYEPLDVQVVTDEKWLSFVIEQVLSNALKYTRTGSITIDMEPGDILCIRDTGIGIAPEDLPRIFEKGYTGYNGRIDKKASGLGLYLCSRICKNLGHTITVYSDLGQGTIVRIGLSREKLETE